MLLHSKADIGMPIGSEKRMVRALAVIFVQEHDIP